VEIGANSVVGAAPGCLPLTAVCAAYLAEDAATSMSKASPTTTAFRADVLLARPRRLVRDG
jgi:hypothetical protein